MNSGGGGHLAFFHMWPFDEESARVTIQFDTMIRVPSVSGPTKSDIPAYQGAAKRILDVTLVLAVSLPVILTVLALALAVALEGGRPFYRQVRVGRGGRLFRMWKLRTMVPDADKVLQAHLAAHPEDRIEWDRSQKLRNDPRITPVGRILRRTSLDELPQFLNVLVGDMSLVGPRPMLPSQQALYPGTEYYEMRPGVTGFWQVSERHETSFAQRAGFDRSYYHAVSPVTDLTVMMKTLVVVMRGTGV